MKSKIHEHKKNNLLNVSKKQILILLIAVVSASTFAQTSKSANHVNTENGVAIQGYDPVAYFENNKAVKGNKAITATYDDVLYYFSSEKNKASFLKDPNHFIPQFGGYCAYGMSEGHEAPIQPESFSIVDNKLYLNYNVEVKDAWLVDKKNLIQKANENWKKIN